MLFLIIMAVLSLTLGLSFFISEDFLKKMEKAMNRVVSGANTKTIKNRKVIGAILIVLSLVLFWIFVRYKI